MRLYLPDRSPEVKYMKDVDLTKGKWGILSTVEGKTCLREPGELVDGELPDRWEFQDNVIEGSPDKRGANVLIWAKRNGYLVARHSIHLCWTEI